MTSRMYVPLVSYKNTVPAGFCGFVVKNDSVHSLPGESKYEQSENGVDIVSKSRTVVSAI